MRRAIERCEFFVLYQPILNLEMTELAGFEALVRWQHPERGLISPAEFIPIAEETGLIVQIGGWVLEESCRQMRAWQQQYRLTDDLTISVNLSGKQFVQTNLVEQVGRVLQETNLAARCLRLEITESVIMNKADEASKMLKQLKTLGVQLSIDDFGTGYSSLSYLHNFPCDVLKIDRSFVNRMADDGNIVQTIIMLAHNLKMKVVAEGIEEKYQERKLRELNCEYGQGFLYSKPVDKDCVEQMLIKATSYDATNLLPQNIFDGQTDFAIVDSTLSM